MQILKLFDQLIDEVNKNFDKVKNETYFFEIEKEKSNYQKPHNFEKDLSMLISELKKIKWNWVLKIIRINEYLHQNCLYEYQVQFYTPILLIFEYYGYIDSRSELKEKIKEIVALSNGKLSSEPYEYKGKTSNKWEKIVDNAFSQLRAWKYISGFKITEEGKKYLEEKLSN